jgi:hypothetical protein
MENVVLPSGNPDLKLECLELVRVTVAGGQFKLVIVFQVQIETPSPSQTRSNAEDFGNGNELELVTFVTGPQLLQYSLLLFQVPTASSDAQFEGKPFTPFCFFLDIIPRKPSSTCSRHPYFPGRGVVRPPNDLPLRQIVSTLSRKPSQVGGSLVFMGATLYVPLMTRPGDGSFLSNLL